MGFSRQEFWSGLPFPSPGDLPHPGIEPASLASPALAGRFFTTSATWEEAETTTLLPEGRDPTETVKFLRMPFFSFSSSSCSQFAKPRQLQCQRFLNPWAEIV